MSYTAPTITDRIAVGDNKYKFTISGDIITLTPFPDSVTEPGTDINKALLQPLVDAVATHGVEIYTNIPQAMTEIDAGLLKNSKGFETITLNKGSFAFSTDSSNPKFKNISIPYDRYIMYVESKAKASYYREDDGFGTQNKTIMMVCSAKDKTFYGLQYNQYANTQWSFITNTFTIYYENSYYFDRIDLHANITESGITFSGVCESGITIDSMNVTLTYMQI